MMKANQYSSYHEGELTAQTRAGVGSDGLAADAMYRAVMPTGVQRFLSAQQLAVLSTMDAEGRVWASMRSGPPGFLHPLDESTVEIGGYSHPSDPLLANLTAHAEAGMIVIHLAARHRVRLNGTARTLPDGRIVLSTRQVYGNCPQYIQARVVIGDRAVSPAPARFGKRLDRRQQHSIEQADTLFIATAHPQSGADASHRGGRPGFVCVGSETRLLFPDYRGNNMFNTLGNIVSNPRTGLLFPDFQSGGGLQLSGSARILWDDPRVKQFEAAQRLVEFDIERVIELPEATLLRFEFQSYSPILPGEPRAATSKFRSCDAQSGAASPADRSSLG
jgi:predicted pyridoxine 5'-phosphate oxidase superfamily flavin-nucleotide-binding protein